MSHKLLRPGQFVENFRKFLNDPLGRKKSGPSLLLSFTACFYSILQQHRNTCQETDSNTWYLTALAMGEGGLDSEFMRSIVALSSLNIWSKNWLRLSEIIVAYNNLLINNPLHRVPPSPISCTKLHQVFDVFLVPTIARRIDILWKGYT